MSKGMVFVVAYSIFLVALFCVMCYLMTTVNPPPLTIVGIKDNSSRRFMDLNLKPIVVNNLPSSKSIGYGLERIRDEELLTEKTYPYYIHATKSIDGFNGPAILETQTVLPPLWPAPTEPWGTIHLPIVILNDDSKLNIKNTSMKAFRRSVNDEDDNTSAIIFKILHGGSRPRIEIKLNDAKNKNGTVNKSNPKFGLSAPSDNGRGMEKYKLSDKSVIKIMSNDTVVIYDGNPTESGKMDHVDDIKNSVDKRGTFIKNVNKNNSNQAPTSQSRYEMQSTTHRKLYKYTRNIGIKEDKIDFKNGANNSAGILHL